MFKKIWVAGSYVTVIFILIVYRNSIVVWMEEGNTLSLPLEILLTLLLAFFPVIPFGVVAGYLGSQYGWIIGGLIGYSGSAFGSILMFFLVRYVFKEQGRKLLKKYKPIDRFTVLVEKNVFFAVLITRLIPVIPSQVISVYSALSTMSSRPYMIATLLGKIPFIVVFALIGNTLMDPLRLMIIAVVYGVFLLLVYIVYRRWNQSID